MAEKLFSYGKWVGLDAVVAPENMNERYLATLENGYVDYRGQINSIYGSVAYGSDVASSGVLSCKHYGRDEVVYGVVDGSRMNLRSTTGLTLTNAFSGDYNVLDHTQFLDKLITGTRGQTAISYNGTAFSTETAIPQAGCMVTLLNRLVVADIPGKDTTFQVSQTDLINFTIGTGASTAAEINIRNQLTSKDRIRGLGVLEGDKLAVFCENETLLYAANADISLWTIVRDFRVPIGTIGRRTIKGVGNDLFFCSKFGVHSIRRAANGVTLETINFSRAVQEIYDELVLGIPSGREPHAVWNPNQAHYAVYFPKSNNTWARMLFTFEPGLGGRGAGGHQSWSYDANCDFADGSYFSGQLVAASYSLGLREQFPRGENQSVNFRAKTPVLWQGSPHIEKRYKRLKLRASGTGKLTIKVYNEFDTLLQTTEHYPEAVSPFPSPIPAQAPERPIDVPLIHRAKGLRFEFLGTDATHYKIMDMAVTVEF